MSVNVVNAWGSPVSVAYNATVGTFTQGAREYQTYGSQATARAVGGAGGSATSYTLESVDPLMTVPADGRLPFFYLRAEFWLRTSNRSTTPNIGGVGSMSAAVGLEIPGIMSCSYAAGVETTDFRRVTGNYPYGYMPSGKNGLFSFTFMGQTTSRTDVEIGGPNGWFPGELREYAPITLQVYYPVSERPEYPPTAMATLSYQTDFSAQLEWQAGYQEGAQTSSSLTLGPAAGVTLAMTTTPGPKKLRASMRHLQTAAGAVQIADGNPFAELAEITTTVAQQAAAATYSVRGVYAKVCGPGPCEV